MTTVLTPSPKQKFFDNNGAPLNKGKLFVYQAGTSTKATTWTDSTGGTPNTNPIILDYRGECNLWISPNVSYKYVLAPSTDTDPPTNAIWTVDNIVSSQLITLYGGVDTGIANAYVLNFTANFTALTDGIVIYWVAANTNTGASTINVNGLGVLPIFTATTSGYASLLGRPGMIIGGTINQIVYQGGQWVLISSFPVSGTFTGTYVGGTTSPTATISYLIMGRMVSLSLPTLPFTATSNSTSFSISGLPQTITPVGVICYFPFLAGAFQDNGAIVNDVCMRLGSGLGNSIQFLKNGSVTGFNAAGTKGFNFGNTISYAMF